MEHRGTLGGKREELRSLLHFAEQSKSSLKIWAEWGIDSHFPNSFLGTSWGGTGRKERLDEGGCSLPLLTFAHLRLTSVYCVPVGGGENKKL